MYNNLDIFISRMEKLGIKVEVMSNYPWVYITSISGVTIKAEDYYQSRHGFTLGYSPIRPMEVFKFNDITKIFKLIRKYATNTNVHRASNIT
jgi:hypothetical protein